jgi:hypothetical protein
MSEPQVARSARYSLQARILGAVFVLVLAMYLATLAVLGVPLVQRAQQNLDGGAQRELGAMMAAIQDHVLLRDYPAIEQAIEARARTRPCPGGAFRIARTHIGDARAGRIRRRIRHGLPRCWLSVRRRRSPTW